MDDILEQVSDEKFVNAYMNSTNYSCLAQKQYQKGLELK